MDFGPVRRWREGDVLFAENDFIKMAYAVADDTSAINELGLGWVPYRDTKICVEFISAQAAKQWDAAESVAS